MHPWHPWRPWQVVRDCLDWAQGQTLKVCPNQWALQAIGWQQGSGTSRLPS